MARFPADFMLQLNSEEYDGLRRQTGTLRRGEISKYLPMAFTEPGGAVLYGLETRALNQAVKRNRDRFPDDFMFALTREEIMRISQSVTSSSELKYSRKVYAFTEQGVAMLSCVLNSPRAIQVNIAIMRAFVQLRAILSTHADLARKLEELEKKYDGQFRVVFDALRQLMTPTAPSRKQIGLEVKERAARYGRKAKRPLG